MGKPLNKAKKRLVARKAGTPKGKAYTEPGSMNSHKTQSVQTYKRQFRKKRG